LTGAALDGIVWQDAQMNTDAEPTTADKGLYGLVQERLAEARALVADLEASDEVKEAVERRLKQVEGQAEHELTDASRRLEALLDALESGRPPVAHDD
jgi:hypothetical protein